MKREWLEWWAKLSPWRRATPTLIVLVYWAALSAVGGLKYDLVVVSLAGAILYYLGPRFRPIFSFMMPFVLTATLYDSQRYYADYIRGPIHVREPYDFDKYFFGIPTAEGVLTPNEWFQKHTHWFLDFISGIAYIIFIPVYVLVAAYYRFILSRKGNRYSHARATLYRSPQIMWAFFWVNVIGWSTYYWYAASPPWYAALYGFGPARTDIPANIAGCARFDALVGIPIFKEWYSHSADVHGAIPSLHVAYPFMSFYYALRFGSLRIFTFLFYCLVSFAAVYLNHHYILDVIWGTVYAIAVAFSIDMLWNYNLKRKGIVVPGHDPVPGTAIA